MISDELGKQLHDRATRGETLSSEEQAQLEAWYTAQDRAETEELGLTGADKAVSALRAQVDSALVRIGAITGQIQELEEENEALRREVAALRHQLTQRVSSQLA